MSDSLIGQREIERHQSASSAPASRRLPFSAVLSALLLIFLLLPILALFWRAGSTSGFWAALTTPTVLDALWLTLLTSLLTLCLAFLTGTPLAWVLTRKQFRGRRLVDAVVDLPLVLPPVVAGVALLMAFGRRGLLGDQLALLGLEIPFTTAAVVLAQLFVAVPFYVRGARLGFLAVPTDVEEAAAIDGATPWDSFRRVTLPLALPGILSGAALCWARALSEFGATLMFAGNIAGRTQTMPLAIMSAMETDLGAALALSVLLVIGSAIALLLTRLVLSSRVDM